MIEKFVREGRLVIGPYYTLAEQFSISHEALIRNLIFGKENVEKYGGKVGTVAYTPSSWGQTGQYPQILSDFGLEKIMFYRGISHHESKSEYCIEKYCPGQSLAEARRFYFEHTHREMEGIMKGKGRTNAFVPTEGLKEFLLELKSRNIRIGLVTSGLYEKAYPEILSAFKTLDMGDPKDFYDCIITAGFPLKKGGVGTLGELSPKPHPWLYAEAGCVGLGIPFTERNQVIGIEDSGAGVCSLRLAGYPTIGIAGGNIVESGTEVFCCGYEDSFNNILNYCF